MKKEELKKGFFITGTDTDAGKTYVTQLLLEALKNEGVHAAGYKPICCGDRDDAVILKQASLVELDLNEINPIWLKTPAAPHVAAIFENEELDITKIKSGFKNIENKSQVTIVEGIGGWKVPISGMNYTVADMAKDINLPVILVVGNRLGALNHTILTIESMRATGVEPVGLIFNNLTDELETATITNKGIIEDLMGVEVITDIIRDQQEVESWPFMELLGI